MPISPLTRNSDGNSHATDVRNDVASKQPVADFPPVERTKQDRPPVYSATAGENDGGALDDLLNDYSYGASQPSTPGQAVTAEYTKHEPVESHAEGIKSLTEPLSTTPTNIRGIDDNPQRQTPVTMSSQPPSTAQTDPSPQDHHSSIAASVLEVLDSHEKPNSSAAELSPADSPTIIPKPTSPSPKSPSSSQDAYASSNYWAQMRANLKTKRSASQDPSSHKSDPSTDKSNRSSNESVRTATPNPPKPAVSDGRSGSFTSYTPIPKFPDQRSPSSPFGRAAGGARPTIDTGGGRTFSMTNMSGGTRGELGQRRGSGSDVKRPVIDIRSPIGNRPALNSPVIASMPLATNGGGVPRPGSRGRNLGEQVYGGDLPVFAPRDGLPLDFHNPRPQSPSRGPPRPQSPSRGLQSPQSPARVPPRPQSPSRGPPRSQSPSSAPPRPQSPSRGHPRPQSPARGPPRPQSPARGVSSTKNIPVTQIDKERRTPSPLKDMREDMKEMAEMNVLPVNRTPSPLRSGIIAEAVVEVNPELPPKDVPVPPKKITPIVSALPAQPQPAQWEKKDTLPAIPPVTDPPQSDLERSRSPSPDAEWRDDQESQPEHMPQKRITVFLQEHGKRKESQGLPPLPTEPPPPLPTQSLPPLPPRAPPSVPQKLPPEVLAESSQPMATETPQPVTAPLPVQTQLLPAVPTNRDDPVERMRKFFELEQPTQLNPPPRAPFLEFPTGIHPRRTESSIDSHAASNPVVPPPVPATHRSIPSSSSIQHSIQHSRSASASAATPMTHSREPSKDSPIHQLPELDVSRPFTWGPLAFEQPLPNSVKEEPEPVLREEIRHLDDVDEEPEPLKEENQCLADVDEEEDEDWEKVEEEDAREEFPPSEERKESPEQPDRSPPEIPSAQRMSSIVNTAEATAPPESETEENADNLADLPDHQTHKSPHPDDISNAASSDIEGDLPSKYRDRDITSFIVQSRGLQSRDSDKPMSRDSDKPILPQLHTNPVPVESSAQHLTLDFLPPFMLGKDIPEMSTVAQRVGAYQSRREQMVKADTGLGGWLIHMSQSRSPSFPQRKVPTLALLTIESPNMRRVSRDSFRVPTSPSASALSFTGSGKVGRKMISKMMMGGKRLGAATKNKIDKLGTTTGDKRTSGDIHYTRPSGEEYGKSPTFQQRNSREEGLESPVVRSSGVSQERIDSEPELKDISYGQDNQPVGLRVSTPIQMTPVDAEPSTSFAQMPLPAQPESTYRASRDDLPSLLTNDFPRAGSSLANPVISAKEETQGAGRHKFSSSISVGGKVSKLFTTDSKQKHHSDSTEYPSTSPQQSPRQKSKFSKFVSDLSQSSVTGKRPESPVTASPNPPPPPDKSQFRSPAESSSRLKGFLADLNSRDITGKPQTSHGSPTTSSRVPADRPSTSGFSRFISELGKRDITGRTEEERIAMQRRREQEVTYVPAQSVVYDETASDWEIKLEKMEDVLPHIPVDILVDSLKRAGGDEERAIGLAVIKMKG